MKSILMLSLLGLAAAQPHGHQNHRRFHQHHKRAGDTITDVVTVMETAPAVVVMVDNEGNVLYTSQVPNTPEVQAAAATPAPPEQNAAPSAYSFPSSWKSKSKPTHKPKPSKKPSPTKQATTSTPPPPPATTEKPTPATTATPTSSATATSTAGGSGGYIGGSQSSGNGGSMAGYGVSYSPYNADGTCKSASDVSSDFTSLKGFSYVRSYGVDCNQVPNMMQAAKANGLKIFLGVFNIDGYEADIDTMASAVKANGGWDMVTAVSIGNEDVNQGKASVDTIVAATNGGRSKLRSAGFNGPVVHVDTFNQIIENPALCKASDFAAANCHAFFDPNTAAKDAGSFVQTQVDAMKKACGGKEVHITESGWPHEGQANGKAVPSPADQQAALSSLKSQFSSNFVFFSAFNNKWKDDNAGTFGAEKCWGMFDQGIGLKGF